MLESKSISPHKSKAPTMGIFFDGELAGTITEIDGAYRLILYKPLFDNSYPTSEAALAAATMIYYSGAKE